MSRHQPHEIVIRLKPLTGDFAENKDAAAALREQQVRRGLADGRRVVLDFTGVRVATQSFVHALVSDILRRDGEGILERLIFKGCTQSVKGIVETVVQYSLESIEPDKSLPKSDKSGRRN